MDVLLTIMTMLTMSAAAILVPRLMIDWQRIREFLRDSDERSLRQFAADQKRWVARHCICAVGAICLGTIITCAPGMAPFEKLAGVTTAYGMMTLTLTFIESHLAQRAESHLQARLASARQPHEFGR